MCVMQQEVGFKSQHQTLWHNRHKVLTYAPNKNYYWATLYKKIKQNLLVAVIFPPRSSD